VQGRCALGASCFNGVEDADSGEADVDCGGGDCPPCAPGRKCFSAQDCMPGSACTFGLCVLSSTLSLVSTASGGTSGAQLLTFPVVTGSSPAAGPGGGGTVLTVQGRRFISIGAAWFRLLSTSTDRPFDPIIVTTCDVVSEELLSCALGEGTGSALVTLQYRTTVSEEWQAVPEVSDGPLTYTYTYVVDQVVAMVPVSFPPIAVAGSKLPPIKLVAVDGSGGSADGNSNTDVMLFLHPPELDPSTMNGTTLQSRGLTTTTTPEGTCSAGPGVVVRMVNGSVTFTNVTIDAAEGGEGYVLVVVIPGTTVVVTTPPFDVYQPLQAPTSGAGGAGGAGDDDDGGGSIGSLVCQGELTASGECCSTGVDRCGVCGGGSMSCSVSVLVRVNVVNWYTPSNVSALVRELRDAVVAITGLLPAQVHVSETGVVLTSSVAPLAVEAEVSLKPTSGGGNATHWSAVQPLVEAVYSPTSPLYHGPIIVARPGSSVVVTPRGVCGNGVCEVGEGRASCSGDCANAQAPVGSNGVRKPSKRGNCSPTPVPTVDEAEDKLPRDRIPALVSVAATIIAVLAMLALVISQSSLGVSEKSTAVAAVGPEFGGVGAGLPRADLGLWHVVDAAQFVVMAGQLCGAATPWVVRYFVEYFTPFVGLIPIGGKESALPHMGTTALRHAPPLSIAVLLQPGYWQDLNASTIMVYMLWMALLWTIVGTIVAVALAWAWLPQLNAAVTDFARASVSPLSPGTVTPSHMSPLRASVLWVLGRLTVVWAFVVYGVAVTSIHVLWQGDGDLRSLAAAALLLVCIAPTLLLMLLSRSVRVRCTVAVPGSLANLLLGPLMAAMHAPSAWCSAVAMVDRIVTAVVVVVASSRPTLLLVLVVAKSLLWLYVVGVFRPFRNAGVQHWSVGMAAVRACVLVLSVAFIPSAASDNSSRVLVVGYVVALLHMLTTISLATLAITKLVRTVRGGRPTRPTKKMIRNPMFKGDAAVAETTAGGDVAAASASAGGSDGNGSDGKEVEMATGALEPASSPSMLEAYKYKRKPLTSERLRNPTKKISFTPQSAGGRATPSGGASGDDRALLPSTAADVVK
jgi:hypothetical protein